MTRSAAAWTSADSVPSSACAQRNFRSRSADSVRCAESGCDLPGGIDRGVGDVKDYNVYRSHRMLQQDRPQDVAWGDSIIGAHTLIAHAAGVLPGTDILPPPGQQPRNEQDQFSLDTSSLTR